ncbi:branched-chain amino acid ABC transporter permease [Halobacteriales archaeon QS_4_66_20]|nr:MAG: branched-chain amino acid ABC transporter permease [Halobacteriales archaeon QS_4_66_20]
MGVSGTYDRGRELFVEDPIRAVIIVVAVVLVLDGVRQLAVGATQFSELGVMLKDGLMRGLFFGLAGIGLSMTYSILNFANFSHGDLITGGAFGGMIATYVIAGGFGSEGDIGSLMLLGSGATAIALALVIDRLVYKPIRDRSGITLLITSIGVAFTLRYLILFVFDGSRRGVTQSGAIPTVDIPAIDGTVSLNLHELSLVVVAVGLMAGLHFLLQRTKLGKAMRAMSDNEDLARITGIPTERIVTYTWIIGAGLAGVAGYMFVIWNGTLHWFQGWILLLPIFAAVILGGIGSIYGAILGGLVIGLTMSISIMWLPSGLTRAAAFFIMIVVLLVRPQGIFAGRATA